MEDKKIIILNIIRNELEIMKKGDVGFMKDCGFEVENDCYWQIIAKGSNGNVFTVYPMDFIESVKQNGYSFKPSSEAGNPVEAKANEYWIKYFYNKILDF